MVSLLVSRHEDLGGMSTGSSTVVIRSEEGFGSKASLAAHKQRYAP
jgi:hypothetical protein